MEIVITLLSCRYKVTIQAGHTQIQTRGIGEKAQWRREAKVTFVNVNSRATMIFCHSNSTTEHTVSISVLVFGFSTT